MRSLSKITVLILALVSSFTFTEISFAQPRGGLRGRVIDIESGNPLPGVNVLLP